MAVSLDLADRLAAYEDGELPQDEAIALFQYLVDTGLAWKLQGSYGRAAMALIEAGAIQRRCSAEEDK
jgi:hypothetical protein